MRRACALGGGSLDNVLSRDDSDKAVGLTLSQSSSLPDLVWCVAGASPGSLAYNMQAGVIGDPSLNFYKLSFL